MPNTFNSIFDMYSGTMLKIAYGITRDMTVHKHEYAKSPYIFLADEEGSGRRVPNIIMYGKQFIIINNMNSITYKEIFPLLKENRMWIGYTNPKQFVQPDGTLKFFGNILWHTRGCLKNKHLFAWPLSLFC